MTDDGEAVDYLWSIRDEGTSVITAEQERLQQLPVEERSKGKMEGAIIN